MRRKARMRLIIFLLTITLGTLALAQANQESASVAAIQQSPPTGTYFDHIVFIIMENEGIQNICNQNPPPCNGGTNTPYMASLANNYTIGSQYLSVFGSSEPNYVAILGGSLEGCSSGGCPVITAPNLVDRFESAGLTWKAYMENQTPTTGCDTSTHGFYEHEHNPFVEFQDITNNTSRCNKIALANPTGCGTTVDCVLSNDLNNATNPAPNFMWLTPNDCDNMHAASGCTNGCTSGGSATCINDGNNYLKSLVPNILKSRTFTTTRAALFIAFDEGTGFCPLPGHSSEDCLYAVWSGPVTKIGFVSSNLYNQYSFTKTLEANWGLASLASNDASATAMAEFFNSQAPDFTITSSPSSLAFPSGNSANSTITLNSLGSFAGTVTLTKTSTPTGLTVTLNPTSITLTSGGTGTSTLSISSSQIGNYTTTITGTSGTHTHNTNVTVQVTPPLNFAISASPSSLTLTHTLSGAGSPVAITPTGDQTVFESSYLTNSFYAKGLIWLFYEDSRNNCEHHAGCLTYTTSTNGSIWATPTTVPVHITDSDFSVYTDGSNVFYVRYNETTYENDCGRNLQFRVGALSTSGTVAWQPEQTVFTGASNRDYPDDKIIVDSNGQVWIAYMIDNHSACGGDGTDTPQVLHSAGTNYSSWTGNTTLTNAQSDNWHIALVSLGNGEVYASYWINTGDLHGQLYNNGWKGDEQISATTTSSDVNAWLFNSGTNVYAIYFDNNTENFNFASRSSTGTWTVNTIGPGEADASANTFTNYYSLPDTASYDSANNQFHLFYMNATNRKIDEWTGSGSNWNRTIGLVNTAAVPYADSITSFIQSSPTEIGGIFYISGASSPFTINFAPLTFASSSLTGTFLVTVTSQNGFVGTVTLTTTTIPSTGLNVTCSPTTITGGSGSSLCSLTGTTPGTYNVNVTGVSGSLSHSTSVAVTVPSGPDFQITATSPTSANVGQSPTSTMTITALSGFTGVVALTDTIPNGLSCGAISPGSITNSGTATVSCSSTMAGNYTLTVTGSSGSLNHSTTALFRFQDFTTSATAPPPVDTTQSATSTITIAALNHFNGAVNLTDTIPSGLTCNAITPASLNGSGTATVSCSASIAGNYTLTLTGSSGSLSHSTTALLRFQDFTISATSPTPVNAGQLATSTVTVTAINGFLGTVTFSVSPPAGLTCGSFAPASVTGSGSATVSCTATVAGNYTAPIAGTSTPLIHNATSLFQFRDFTITASSPTPANAGSSASSTITIAAVNHFAGVVSLTDTVPSGLTCGTITPGSLTGSGTATVSCNAASAGNYTLTITGTGGSLVHTALAVFRFQNFTITASSPAPVNSGKSATSNITIGAANGFARIVNLTDTVPSGLTCGPITPGTLTGSGTAAVSCSATVAGTYVLTVTGTNGTLVHSATGTFNFVDFTIAASSPAAVNAGQSATSSISVTAVNSFAGVVSLTDTVPSGLICGIITPGTVTGSGTATVSCTATVAGTYVLTLTGTSGTLVHTAVATFNFVDFTVASSSPAPVNAGSSAISTITVVAVNGFAGTVSLNDTVPLGLTCGTISPISVTGSGSATVSCTATVAGNYTLTVTGTNGSLVHSATALFQFRDFAIASSPVTVNAGASGTSTITVTAVNKFAGTVTLNDALPSGLTCGSFTPSSIAGSGSATIMCIATISGNYTLTVTGTSGSLVHSTTALFQVQDFTITVASPAGVNVGVSVSSTVTISALNGFTGVVGLTDTVPSGLTCGALTPGSTTGSGTATTSCNASAAGNYTLTVTGASGSLSHSATALFQFRDFTITASTPAVSSVGVSVLTNVTLTSLNHFGGIVSLSDSVPSGLACGAISPASLTGSGTATVSCSSTTAGNYTLTITGTSTSLVHNAAVTFQFSDFTVTATSPAPINAGNTANSSITVTAFNHFAGSVSLTDATQSGLACGSITPSSIIGSGTATVSCSASVEGNYTLTIVGTGGSLVHNATATFRFQDFAISASSPGPVNAGSSTNSTITLSSLNGFAGGISLNDTAPSGLTCSAITPASLSGSGTATISCSSSISGNYTLTLAGMSGSLVHSATALFQVRDFTITATSQTAVNVSTSSVSTITVTALNRFSGIVTISDTVPSGLACGAIVPSSVTGSGTVTISCSSSVAGNFTLSITGTSGPLVHGTSVLFQFWDFSVSASLPVPLNAGSSANSTITITASNHFNNVVSLSDTVPLGLVCGTINPSSLTGSGSATISCNAVSAGNYTLTVTGTSSSLVHNATALFQFRDFTIAAGTPAPVNVGSSATSTITITPANHFNGIVTLTEAAGSGLVCGSINPGNVTGSGAATVSCSAVVAGNYTLTVTGTSSPLTHSAVLIISVQDYSITANPVSAKVNAGGSGSAIITIVALNGFSGTVSLSASGSTGLTFAINPASLTDGSGTATLTFSSNTAGNYTATVTGSSGALTHTVIVNVQVVDFGVAANPATITILAVASGSSTLTITSLNGFNGTVSLVVTSSMGLTATATPTGIAGAGTSTLSATAAASGDYSITVRATSGSLSHTIGLIVHVIDYSLAASPPNLMSPVGSTTSSTLTVQSLNGYAGNLTVTDTVQSNTITPGAGGLGGHRPFTFAPPEVLPTVLISPQSFEMVPGGTQQCSISVSLPSNLPAGNYLITLTVSDGALSHQIPLTVIATDFSLTATPNSASMMPGSNTTITLNLQSLNFFQGNVNLALTFQAGGPTGTLTTSVVQLAYYGNVNLNLTIDAPTGTALGNYTITVQATSGTISNTVIIPVKITTTGFGTILAEIVSPQNSASIIAVAIFCLLTVVATLKVRTYRTSDLIAQRTRRIQNSRLQHSTDPRYRPYSSTLQALLVPFQTTS